MFIDNKYTKWYYNIVATAKINSKIGYVEKHHIIPKSLGGKHNKENLVLLSAREHYVCHKLLTKMVTDNAKYKMLEAFSIFSNNKNRTLRFSSKDISMMREANAIASKHRNQGNEYWKMRKPDDENTKLLKSDNAKRSRWVNNGFEERFSLEHEKLILSGYVYGRMPYSQEWKDKIAKNTHFWNLKGIQKTEKEKENISIGAKKRKEKEKLLGIDVTPRMRILMTCEHCNKTMPKGPYTVWHGDKCKNKPAKAGLFNC